MMPNGKFRRLRPRFSIRIVFLIVALICVYLACWTPTERHGLQDVEDAVFWRGERPDDRRIVGINASAPLPFVVGIDVNKSRGIIAIPHRYYYFWCFGIVAKIPFERTIPIEEKGHWSRVVRTGMPRYEIEALLGKPDRIVGKSKCAYADIGTFEFDGQGRVSRILD